MNIEKNTNNKLLDNLKIQKNINVQYISLNYVSTTKPIQKLLELFFQKCNMNKDVIQSSNFQIDVLIMNLYIQDNIKCKYETLLSNKSKYIDKLRTVYKDINFESILSFYQNQIFNLKNEEFPITYDFFINKMINKLLEMERNVK